MVQGRREAMDRLLWEHTAALCATIINFAPFNQKQVSPAQLNPYSKPIKPLMMPLRQIMQLVDLGAMVPR